MRYFFTHYIILAIASSSLFLIMRFDTDLKLTPCGYFPYLTIKRLREYYENFKFCTVHNDICITT